MKQKNLSAAGFSDVKSDAYYAKPVEWAVEQGITTGKTDDTFAPNGTITAKFSPNSSCTLGQIVTYLHSRFVAQLENSAFVVSVTKPAASDVGKLDALPLVDYMEQSDWCGTLTPAHTVSKACLAAELEQIQKVVAARRAKDIYMRDGLYSREFNLRSLSAMISSNVITAESMTRSAA